MTEKEKLKQYLDFKNIKRNRFYKETGLSNGFLESGKGIGSDKIKTIISKYPDINLDWLILGIGQMVKDKDYLLPETIDSNFPEANETKADYNSNDHYKEELIERIHNQVSEIKRLRNQVNDLQEQLKDVKRDKELYRKLIENK